MKEQAEKIEAAVKEIAAGNHKDGAVFTLTRTTEGAVTIAVAGAPEDIIMTLIGGMQRDNRVRALITTAVQALGVIPSLIDDDAPEEKGPCDCPICTARRENIKNNPNIN